MKHRYTYTATEQQWNAEEGDKIRESCICGTVRAWRQGEKRCERVYVKDGIETDRAPECTGMVGRKFTFAGYKNPGTRRLIIWRVDKLDGDGFIAHRDEDKAPDADGKWTTVFSLPHGDCGNGDITWIEREETPAFVPQMIEADAVSEVWL